jgi:hypothetical protein
MDARTARETVIKPKLAEVFGNAITGSLITAATVAGMAGGAEKERLTLIPKDREGSGCPWCSGAFGHRVVNTAPGMR